MRGAVELHANSSARFYGVVSCVGRAPLLKYPPLVRAVSQRGFCALDRSNLRQGGRPGGLSYFGYTKTSTSPASPALSLLPMPSVLILVSSRRKFLTKYS